MKRNVMITLAAALLIIVGLSRGYTPDLPSEVYHAEVITDAGTQTPESNELDIDDPEPEPDKPEPDEPGLDGFAPDSLDPDPPESGESDPEAVEPDLPESDLAESGVPEPTAPDVPAGESGAEEPAAPPTTGEETGMQGAPPDMAGAPPIAGDLHGTESEPESVPEPEVTEPDIETESEAETPETSEAAIPEAAFEFASAATGEAVVKTYEQLKDALANDNGITTVYFGADIAMLDGIKINPKKAAVTVSGLNPLESGQTRPYTLTDLDSATFYDAIYVDEVGTKSIHVRDLTIVGKNFYGPFSVFDMGSLAGFVITYERVSYDGPQLGYNRRGTVRIIDCSARIHGGNGILSPNQEFSEVKHLIFAGSSAIDTVSNAYSVFWHPFGGSFTVADDASLTLASPNTSAAFGVFFADSYLYKLDVSVGSRAVFDMTISGFVAPELYVTLNSLTVHEGGAFYLKATASATAAVLRMGGPLTVEKDAKFIVSGYGGTAFAALRQESGDITVEKDATFRITSDNPYASLLNLVGRALICRDPLSVLFVNGRRDIQASVAAGRVFVDTQQVNYWNTPSSGGLDDPPLYKWTKADRSNVVIDGTLSFFGNTDFSGLTSNHLSTDPPGVSPNPETFSMVNARTLAFGRLSLIAAAPTTQSTAISGVTEAGAVVRVSFTQQGADYTLPDAVADAEGAFHIPVGVGLQAGTVINIKAWWQYLTAEAEVTVTDDGRLTLFVPDVLEFFTSQLSASAKTVKRVNPEWKIVVSDTRGKDGNWSLYARLEGQMAPIPAGLPPLKDALIFINSAGVKETMYAGDDILIAKHTPVSGEDVHSVIWNENRGILLAVKPGAAFADIVYTASITWTLVDGV